MCIFVLNSDQVKIGRSMEDRKIKGRSTEDQKIKNKELKSGFSCTSVDVGFGLGSDVCGATCIMSIRQIIQESLTKDRR